VIRHSPIKRRRKPRRWPSDIPADSWRNPEYRRYLREEGRCVVPGCYSHQLRFGGGICDPAHTEKGGMRQRGPDSSCVPMCRSCHDCYDGKTPLPKHADGTPRPRNHAAFEEFYGVDMKAEAAKWWAAFQERRQL
jgi:hypothetical protein